MLHTWYVNREVFGYSWVLNTHVYNTQGVYCTFRLLWDSGVFLQSTQKLSKVLSNFWERRCPARCPTLPEDSLHTSRGAQGWERGAPLLLALHSPGLGVFLQSSPPQAAATELPQCRWAGLWPVLPAAVPKRMMSIPSGPASTSEGKPSLSGSARQGFLPPVCKARCKTGFWMLNERWIFSSCWLCLRVVDFSKTSNFAPFWVKCEIVNLLVCSVDFPPCRFVTSWLKLS